VTTPAGCKGTDDVNFTVIPSHFIQVSNDTAICPGKTAQIHAIGPTIASVAWHPNLYMSDSSSLDPFVMPVTNTTYTVVARDTSYCLDSASVSVIVKPGALVNLPDSVRIYPGETYTMDPGGNGLYFNWFPPYGLTAYNISNPIASPSVNTRYFVDVKTEFGCVTRDSIDVLVSPESYINVPNAFSPGSQPNSTIKVLHLGKATLKSFRIFNRWGKMVFEAKDIDDGWDGTLGGKPQPMGVYVYMVEAVSAQGRPFVKQGNITLIR
jgi:gliding motility-associated-like protein